MTPIDFRMRFAVLSAMFGLLLSGCTAANHTEAGATTGAGLGAIIGAIIGHQTGDTGKGAIIGAAAGALGGGLLGNAEDELEKRDKMVRQAVHRAKWNRAQRIALTNRNIIEMTRSGLSDQVVMDAINAKGGRFDTTADALITLRQNGVSDDVMQLMLQYGERQ